MSIISRLERRAIHFIFRRPKSLIIIASVVFLVFLIGFESLRAALFSMRMAEYRKSAEVQEFNNAVGRLANMSEKGSDASILCDLRLSGNIGGYNAAYQSDGPTVSTLLQEVRNRAETVVPSPAFHSVLTFLPQLKAQESLGESVHAALKNVAILTKQDSRSIYCSQLLDVLSEVYFLPAISSPEGVAAMRVGQVENFQTNVRKAQNKLRALSPPQEFSNEHAQMLELLNRIALYLRGDDNDYITFSRQVELQSAQLELVLQALRVKSTDLQSMPAKLYLETAILRSE